MRKAVKSTICIIFTVIFIFASPVSRCADVPDNAPFEVDARSAVLMDMKTGTVLYAKNAVEPLPPASVTKVMTLLLTMEAVDSGILSLGDMIQVSEHAASMGGSQVYLEPGEEMKCEDLLKSVIIASANDAAMALAERICGSEEGFVQRMNERAAQLGMEGTHFENPTGLDGNVTNHVTSAYDIALMSRELMKHEKIFDFTTIWMDSIRDGAFGLTNTNRLIRFYSGATGLKTGSTSKAKFCISATAKRGDMHLIAVIMGSPTRDIRNECAKKLLDYGFANYFVYSEGGENLGELPIIGGTSDKCGIERLPFEVLLEASKKSSVKAEVTMPDSLTAPVHKGECVGKVTYKCGDTTVGETDIVCTENVEKIGFKETACRILSAFLLR